MLWDNDCLTQVTGELSTAGKPMRAFVQTFVLAPESPKKYYIRNDFFRYQDDDLISEGDPNEAPGELFQEVTVPTTVLLLVHVVFVVV